MKDKQYETGYLQGEFREVNGNILAIFKECKKYCKRLVVGIPSDRTLPRILGREAEEKFADTKELLENLKIVDRVVEVDKAKTSMEERFAEIHFDVCFCGIEYGNQYERDKAFLEEHGAVLIPILPERKQPLEETDALREVLKNSQRDKKIVLFGTGAYFKQYMQLYGEEYKPCYAVDNDSEKWNTKKGGVLIKNPVELKKEDKDSILVILCCKEYKTVLQQLLGYGAFDYRPMIYHNKMALLDEYGILFYEEKIYLQNAQGKLKKLIKEFDRVCQENHLNYYIVCGSLIGVVRHHDMIPWDDDVDVAMPRRDYEILRSRARDIWENSDFMLCGYDELGDDLFHDFIDRFLYMKEDTDNKNIKKIISGSMYGASYGKIRKEIADKKGIDIFILDNAVGGVWHKIITLAIEGVYALCMGHRYHLDYSDYKKMSGTRKGVLRVINKIGSFIPAKFLFHLHDSLCMYAQNKECQYYFIANDCISYIGRQYDKSLFSDSVRSEMGDTEVMIPSGFDGVLKMQYGDYMNLPPLSRQAPTHWLSFRRGV